jgi:hypothetical protein
MSSATQAPTPRKRVRFNEKEAEFATIAPSKKANEVFSEACLSLLPAIRNIVEYFFKKFLKLQITILQLSSKKEKLTNDITIPRSARSNFTLSAKDRENEARVLLNQQVEDCKNTYQSTLKQSILASMDLDLISLTSELQNAMCEALYTIFNAFAIQQYRIDNIPGDSIHPQVLALIRRVDSIIQYSFPDGYGSFSEFYKRKYNITVVMEEPTNDAATDISVLTDNGEASIAFNREYFPRVRTVVRSVVTVATNATNDTPGTYLLTTTYTTLLEQLLNKVFCRSWASYKLEHETRLVNAILNKYSTNVLSTAATDSTAAVVNSEPAVDPKILKDIIAEEVNKATKNLKQQLISIKQTAARNKTAKNSNRGDSKTTGRASAKKSTKQSGAAKKKKESKKSTKEKDSKKKKGQQKSKKQEKADANNNGSQKKKKGRTQKSNKTKQSKRKTSTAN